MFAAPAASNKRKLELEEQKKSSEFQNMGIHKWLLDPVKIPSDLIDERYALLLNDASIQLSESAQKALAGMEIQRLFPVQSQLYKTLLEYLPADRRSWHNLFLQDQPGNHPGDILVSAPTGSGKTLAYVVPVVETLRFRSLKCLRALVILPTMDLVRQVKVVFDKLAIDTDLDIVALSGGMNINDDEESQLISFEMEQQKIVPKTRHHGIFDDFDRLFVEDMVNDFEQSYEQCDILICTPGRLVDHLEKTKGFTLKHLKWLIIDEADKILASDYHDCLAKTLASISSVARHDGNPFTSFRDLDIYPIDEQADLMGQFDDLFDPVTDLPEQDIMLSNLLGPTTHCRKILFSATLTRNPGKIASLHLIKPRLIATTNSNSKQDDEGENEMEDSGDMQRYILPASLRQYYWVCHDPSHKPLYLLKLLFDFKLNATLCFTQSIENADKLYEIVSEFIKLHEFAEDEIKPTVAQYSSSLSIKQRSQVLENFRNGKINILICTDALSRGIDIKGLQEGETNHRAIINYDTPCKVKNYVHRAGRTARAGKDGDLYNLLASHECRHWKEMMRKYALWEGVQSKKLVLDADYEKMLQTYKVVLETVRQKTGRS